MLFRQFLNNLYDEHGEITHVYYEQVMHHSGIVAAHIYGGFYGILMYWCEALEIIYTGITPTSIKKFITGSGKADKDMVIQSVKKLGFSPKDDNEADALALLHLAMDDLGIMTNKTE